MKKLVLIFWAYVFIGLSAARADEPHPEIVLQLGHAGIETAVAWSPDGKLLATGDDGGTVKVWRVARKQNSTGWIFCET